MINYKKLIEKAKDAQKLAYSPYSNFCVGACLLTKSGKTYVGANVENSTYGATICAERNAIMNAVLCGEKEIIAIAICSSSNDYTFPCGICRQTMAEFSKDMEVIVAKNIDDYKVFTLNELLPYSFTGSDIK